MSSIDPAKLVGYRFPTERITYSKEDSALYAISVGFGRNPLYPDDLAFTYEDAPGGFKASPTFTAALSFGFLPKLKSVPGLVYEPMMLLHGEHALKVLKPLQPEGELEIYGQITEIWDKGSGAVVTVETKAKDAMGEIAINIFSLFIRGIGGFGGDRGPKSERADMPTRSPDFVVEEATLPQQALIYRLNGDKNPLHVDPAMAARGGYDRPILHGLCVFGHIARVAMQKFFGNDPEKFRQMKTRFTSPVFPGDTLVHELWSEGDKVSVSTKVKGVVAALSTVTTI